MDSNNNPRIRFEEVCDKLITNDGVAKSATLLQVISITDMQLSKDFLRYNDQGGKESVPQDSLYLLLLFLKGDGQIFTTLRPQFGAYGDKMKWYQEHVGREFSIVITKPTYYVKP